MQREWDALAARIRGKKVAFIGAGVSHRELIPQFVKMGDRKSTRLNSSHQD